MELIFEEEKIKILFNKTDSKSDINYKYYDFSKFNIEYYNIRSDRISFIKRYHNNLIFCYSISLYDKNFDKVEKFLSKIDNLKFIKSKINFIFKNFVCSKKKLYIYSFKNLINFTKIHSRLKLDEELSSADSLKLNSIKKLIEVLAETNRDSAIEFEINNFSFLFGKSKLFITPKIFSTLELYENFNLHEIIKFILLNNKSNSLLDKLEKLVIKSS